MHYFIIAFPRFVGVVVLIGFGMLLTASREHKPLWVAPDNVPAGWRSGPVPRPQRAQAQPHRRRGDRAIVSGVEAPGVIRGSHPEAFGVAPVAGKVAALGVIR